MILQDPSQFPEPEPEKKPDDEQRDSSMIVGSVIVDGIVQILMTWWLTWILREGFNFTAFSPYFWWVGSTLMYVALHIENTETAGAVLIKHIQLMLILTAYTWIFT